MLKLLYGGALRLGISRVLLTNMLGWYQRTRKVSTIFGT